MLFLIGSNTNRLLSDQLTIILEQIEYTLFQYMFICIKQKTTSFPH